MLLNFITNSQNRHCSNFIGRRLAAVEKAILSLCPPSEVTTFRPFSCFKFWTGRDLQNYLFYIVIPIIGFGFPMDHLKHISAFVLGVRLSMSSDARSQSADVKKLFDYFVKKMESLYSHWELTINSHLLLHVHEKVNQFGSLSYLSMASFQAQFKVMKRIVKGSRRHFSQIIEKLLLLKCSSSFLKSNGACNPALSRIFPHMNLGRQEYLAEKKIKVNHHFLLPVHCSEKDSYCKFAQSFGKILDVLDSGKSVRLQVRSYSR